MQVSRSLHQHKATVLELAEDGKWMDAPDLLRLIITAREDVEAAIMTDGLDCTSARELHDVAMASTMFGYLPPMRTGSICSLLHPDYKGPCLFPDCMRPNCHGNRLSFLSRDPLKIQLQLVHHKNQSSWEHTPIQFQIPEELANLLAMWLDQGHKELCSDLLLCEDPPCPHVFMNREGRGYTPNSLGKWWRPWVKKHGGAAALPPSMCRHIFVDERRSDSRAQGPTDKGAAMAMGNSERAWDAHYEKQRHFHSRDCQAAVSAMDVWRDSLLGGGSTSKDAPGVMSQVVIHVVVVHNQGSCLCGLQV